VTVDGSVDGLRVWLACDWFIKYVAFLAAGLADEGCEVTMLTRDHDLEFGGQAGEMRAFVASQLGAGGRHLILHGRVRSLAGVREAVRVRRACAAWAPDIVHVQDSLPNDVRLAFASRLRRGRYALTVHDPVPHPGDAIPPLAIRTLRRLLRREAGLVFVHSDELASELDATGQVRAPIEVVPHGVGGAVTAPFPERASLLFFGRISHYKGLDVLLDAMPSVWRRRDDLGLVIAGEGDIPDHPVLADARVSVFEGHVPEREVPGLLAAATCVVLPYRQASQSGVGSLARQHGRPVVATEVGGLPELVDASWGRLVPPEDARALATAILEVVDTPGLAEQLGSAALAEGEASWRSVAKGTIAAYRRHLL
jgi:glycosyltransferase involved in cell wall biosynthesis